MFDARHPDAPRVAMGAERAHRLAPMRIEPALLAKAGEAFAASASLLQSALATLPPAAECEAALAQAVAEAERQEALGIRLQTVARILAAGASLVPERVDLVAAARAAAASWQPYAQRERIAIAGGARAIEIDIDPAALAQLIELLVGEALAVGDSLELRCEDAPAPAGATLTLVVRCKSAHPEARDSVDWMLFAHLSHALGLAPRRTIDGALLTVSVAFGVPVGHAAEPSAAQLPTTPPVGRRHVLLVLPDETTRFEALRVMRSAGVDVDPTATVAQARESLRRRPADIVVIGIADADGARDALLGEARAVQPHVRIVEVVDDDDAFELGTDADHPARVGRHALARTLLAAMAQDTDAC
jgi:hypothetical protein